MNLVKKSICIVYVFVIFLKINILATSQKSKQAPIINIDKSVILTIYHHLISKESEDFVIEFLYGGRDSSKSYTTAEILIIECLSLPYFRCALIREQSGDVKDSQWQLIKDIVEEWGLGQYFEFRKAPLEIECNLNGNKFIARGCNEIQNLKSITSCNRAWIEEGVKDRESMTVILGTIRSNKSKIKVYYTFNPECEGDYHKWWLFEDWFMGEWSNTNLSFSSSRKFLVKGRGWAGKFVDKEIELKYRVTHTTYHDNPYVSDERIAFHENNKGYYYTVYTLGLFGYKISGGEFLTEFKADKHVEAFEIDEKIAFQITVDSNTAPYVAIGIFQIDDNKKLFSQYAELPCRSPNASAARSARQLHLWLCKVGYEGIIILYGDATANNKSTVDENNASFFDKFRGELSSLGWKIYDRIGKSNPRVGIACDFMNDMLLSDNPYRIRINKTCSQSIEDYTMTKKDNNNGILKKIVKDKETGVSYQERGHFTDIFKYILCSVFSDEFSKYGVKKKGFVGIGQGNFRIKRK